MASRGRRASSPACEVGEDLPAGEAARANSTPSCSAAARPKPRDLPVRGPEPEGHPLRDGVPAPRTRRRCSTRGHADGDVHLRQGQARHRHRRRRHRHRLRGHRRCARAAAASPQLEILPRPPGARAADNPWPQWPKVYRARLRAGGGEGALGPRPAGVLDDDQALHGRRRSGHVRELSTSGRVGQGSRRAVRPARDPGTEKVIPADLVLLAMGFLGPEKQLLEQLGVKLDARGNV